ncbi:dual specificity protein phosphatase family protein [Catenulispora sp. NF23]|uniref:Dual specificity protein phosphatase family protein n=1 Tax=Catenulispora pinistramenti TaxID=2705254 RepID=A0ABS5L1D6_9ACTN|nr:dual specificity protein phosphatase family protein [Catenulispora pinistramenti]MBS2538160.1 dual specificity protein phosphatase family protein [Catenulispora pinistramenti]MBS2551999.1 dual specificity protein phosphatase family protein [Catenulispora pinistramenti]
MLTNGDWDDVPREAWSEVVPRLWMGGHEYVAGDGTSRRAVVADEFDVVYSLTSHEGYGPDPGVAHHVLRVSDNALTAEEIRAVEEFAASAASDYAAGRQVLVRCWAGMNRSGLVVAEVLIQSGYTAADAIAMVRKQRSPAALNNESFVGYLETGLGLAAELVGLGSGN